jgi:hypothetical protein
MSAHDAYYFDMPLMAARLAGDFENGPDRPLALLAAAKACAVTVQKQDGYDFLIFHPVSNARYPVCSVCEVDTFGTRQEGASV